MIARGRIPLERVPRVLVAAYGWRHLEERVPRGLLIRRILAAGLITAAIALFNLGAG